MMQQDELEALERFQAWQALEELKRRLGASDEPLPCPECGSFEHFEC